jgi:hypothetical protein
VRRVQALSSLVNAGMARWVSAKQRYRAVRRKLARSGLQMASASSISLKEP